jgi:4-amino-4-deoxy-L-arabinose transferase-like glycosyltransferase
MAQSERPGAQCIRSCNAVRQTVRMRMKQTERTAFTTPFPREIIALSTAYFLVTLVIRLVLPPGLRMDESQQVFLSQWMAAGYDAQPPLYNWVQNVIFDILNDYVLGLAALKGLVLTLILVTYGKLAHMLLKDRSFTLLATLGLFLTPQFFWQAQRDLTHTTATMLLVNVTLIAALKTLERPVTLNYVALGAAVGLGMLTKYNFAVFIAALMLATLLVAEYRKAVLNWRFGLTVLVAIIIFLPHAAWLIDNLALASTVTVKRMAEDAGSTGRLMQILLGLGNLLAMTAIITAPSAALMLLAFGRPAASVLFRGGNRPLTGVKSVLRPDGRLVGLVLLATLAILAALIFATTFTTLRDRWLLPLLQFMPIFLCLVLQAAEFKPELGMTRVWPVSVLAAILIPAALLAEGLLDTSSHYRQPYREFAAHLRQELPAEPGLIMTTDWHTAGNLKAQWPDVPVLATEFPNLTLPFDEERSIVIIWRDTMQMPDPLRKWLTETGRLTGEDLTHTVSFPYAVPYSGTHDMGASDFYCLVVAPLR